MLSGCLYFSDPNSRNSLGFHDSHKNGDIPVLSFLLYQCDKKLHLLSLSPTFHRRQSIAVLVKF